MVGQLTEVELKNSWLQWKRVMEGKIRMNYDLQVELEGIFCIIDMNLIVEGLRDMFTKLSYRGEPQFYESACVPNIARVNRSKLSSYAQYIQKKTYLDGYELEDIQDFKNSEVGMKIKKMNPLLNENDELWLYLTQHYRSTRIPPEKEQIERPPEYLVRGLDLTEECQVALFFACEKAMDQTGWIYVFTQYTSNNRMKNTYQTYKDHILDVRDVYYPSFKDLASSNHDSTIPYFWTYQDFQEKCQAKGIDPESIQAFNIFRIQKSQFLWFKGVAQIAQNLLKGKNIVWDSISGTSIPIPIPSKRKPFILAELKNLGITRSSLGI